MQLATNSVLSQPPLAAMPQLSEKPRLGFATKKTAWNPGPNVCNFTVTLGLRATVVENGVGETYSARYYNPATGRFMSRDPEDGNAKDPASLHKYLYANGDPVNGWDPMGREDAIDESLLHSWLRTAEQGLYTAAKFVAKYYTCIGFGVADIAFMAGKSNWESNTAMAILWARCLAMF